MIRDDLEEFIKRDILPAEVPHIDAIKLRVALQNILDGDTAFNNGNLEAEDTNKVTDESYQVQLAKNEIKFLNTQLYNEYKKVKQLKQEVMYLEDKLADREQELEHISHKLLNKSLGYREDDQLPQLNWIEQQTSNLQVAGSSPAGCAKIIKEIMYYDN